MQFWFKQGKKSLRLPVNPESFELSCGNLNTTVNIENVGEVNILGKPSLMSISISSFFPAKKYSFCTYSGFPSPYKCVEMIKGMSKAGPVRFIVTGTKKTVNDLFYVENFSFGEQYGSRDVSFTIQLKQYRKVTTTTKGSSKNKPRAGETKTKNTDKKIYRVKKGDTLWAIAKKYLGKGSRYPEIAKLNKLKNPNLIYPGQVLKI